MNKDNFYLRVATSEDGPGCCQIVDDIFYEYGMTFDPQDWDRDVCQPVTHYAPPNAIFLVAEQEGTILGMVGGHLETEYAELHRLYIAPSARGLGLGRALCQKLESWVLAAEKSTIVLWSDVRFIHAHQLYYRLGYRIFSSRILDDPDRSVEFGFRKSLLGNSPPLHYKLLTIPLEIARQDIQLWHKIQHTVAGICDSRQLPRIGAVHQLPEPERLFENPKEVILMAPDTIIGFQNDNRRVFHPSFRV